MGFAALVPSRLRVVAERGLFTGDLNVPAAERLAEKRLGEVRDGRLLSAKKSENFSESAPGSLSVIVVSPCGIKARMTGLEPATSGVTGRCSNQLSYIPNPSR